ncbi:MAG: HAD family phosphatase [Gaiellaceae bacterium]
MTGSADSGRPLEAVVFDMDGVLVDSEEIWDEARRALALEHGLPWPESAQRDMMGMSSPEWSRYMHERVGLVESPEEISAEVVRRLEDLYWQHLPLLEGAVQAVERMARSFRLGLASSSNRPIIELVLELAAIADEFEVTVSSEEVERGKPAPGRLSRGAQALESRARQRGGDRGLDERASLRPRGRHARGRRTQSGVSASRGRAGRGRHSDRLAERARARDLARFVSQCVNSLTPVQVMSRPYSFAASITSESRIEPPVSAT